jgi:hypothetical protein
MRYIKNFKSLIKESTEESSRAELKDFCEMNLAYLIDEDFNISLTARTPISKDNPKYEPGHAITFKLGKLPGEDFTWLQIMDHFIPFLQRLSNNYKVIKCMLSYKEPIDGVITPLGWYKSTVSIQSLIDNQLPKGQFEDTGMRSITIIVEDQW